jgi:hypothetical protein
VTVCTHQGRHRRSHAITTGTRHWRQMPVAKETRSLVAAGSLRKEPIMAATSTKVNGYAKMPAALICDRELSDASKTLYALMRLYAWESSDSTCRVKCKTLAADTGWGLSKLKVTLAELLDAGWIVKKRTGRASEYEVLTAANPAIRQPQYRPSDSRSTGYRYVEVDVLEAATTAAAQETPSENNNSGIEDKAVQLADWIEATTHKRPLVKPDDGDKLQRLIIEYGTETVNDCVKWALADEFWRNATTDRLVRFIGGFDSIRQQMGEEEAAPVPVFKERIYG